MPSKSANVKNEKQYEELKDKGMSKERAAKIANSPGASSRGGKKSGSGGNAKQGGTTAQHKAAGRKGGNHLAQHALEQRLDRFGLRTAIALFAAACGCCSRRRIRFARGGRPQ